MKEPKFRCPTKKAIKSLATRFGFRYSDNMQDWEWEVADYAQIDKIIETYKCNKLSDDERFTLMETIIQSMEDLGLALKFNEKWSKVLINLIKN